MMVDKPAKVDGIGRSTVCLVDVVDVEVQHETNT